MASDWAGNRTFFVIKDQLEATFTFEEFDGYVRPARKVKLSNGDEADLPEPLLHLTSLGIRASLGTNDVLLLGGIRERIFQTTDKVAWLGEIPIIGDRLFTKQQLHTNHVRRLIFIRQKH